VRRGRTRRRSHLRSGSLTDTRAQPEHQGDDVGGGVVGGGVVGGGLEGGGVDGGGDVECDGGGEENFAVGDGEAECFRETGDEVPGCGPTPPAADFRAGFEPGRVGPDRFE
jgi:hypothetical protein